MNLKYVIVRPHKLSIGLSVGVIRGVNVETGFPGKREARPFFGVRFVRAVGIFFDISSPVFRKKHRTHAFQLFG